MADVIPFLEKMLGRDLSEEAKKHIRNYTDGGKVTPVAAQDSDDTEQDAQDDERADRDREEIENAAQDLQDSDDQQEASDEDTDETPASDDSEEVPAAAKASSEQKPASEDQQEEPETKEQTVPAQKPTLDFNSDNVSKEDLQAALDERRKNLANADIQRGLERIAAGVGRQNPDYTNSNEQVKRANLPLEEFGIKQQQESHDPDSGISKGLRSYLGQLGVNVSDQATASQIQQVLPMVYKNFEAQQGQAAKLEQTKELGKTRNELEHSKEQADLQKLDAKYKNEMEKLQQVLHSKSADQNTKLLAQERMKKLQVDAMNARSDIARKDRLETQDTREAKDIFGQLNAAKASSRSPLGQSLTIYQKSNRLKSLVNDPSATVQDMNTAAADLNSMVSQTTTMSGTQHQMYNNLVSDWTKWMGYLNSGAPPVPVPEVKAHLAHVADEMAGISHQMLAANNQAVKMAHPEFDQRHPGRIDDITKSLTAGYEPVSNAELTPDVLDYASKHGLSPEQALALKKKRLSEGQK
jgi:hypothetical protein